jgi:hypothetical protein
MSTDDIGRAPAATAGRALPKTWRLPATWRVYVPLAFLAGALAVAGFWPSYFGPLLTGTGAFRALPLPHGMSVIHVHAAVYMGWLVLVIAQGYLAATRRTALHVKVGRFGFAYGLVVILMGLATAFEIFAGRIGTGDVLRAQRSLFVPFTDMIVFSLLLTAAWLYRHRPDIHKRLIIVATTMLIIAGVGRLPFWHGTQIMTLREAVPFLVVWSAPIYIAMAHDYFRRRIVHPVYVIGLIVLVLVRLRAPLKDSDAWLSFSGWLAKFFLCVLLAGPVLQPPLADEGGVVVEHTAD